MLRGWFADHEWRLAMGCLAGSLVTAVAGDAAVRNPLGESYEGLSLSLLLTLASGAGFALALSSRAAEALSLSVPWQAKILWLLTVSGSCGITLAVTTQLAGGRLLTVLAWTAFATAACMMLVGPVLALTYLLALFLACALSPRGVPAPWWNPVLHSGGSGDAIVAGAIIAGVSSLVLNDVPGRDPWSARIGSFGAHREVHHR